MLPKGQVHDGKSREKDASEGTGSSIRKKMRDQNLVWYRKAILSGQN